MPTRRVGKASPLPGLREPAVGVVLRLEHLVEVSPQRIGLQQGLDRFGGHLLVAVDGAVVKLHFQRLLVRIVAQRAQAAGGHGDALHEAASGCALKPSACMRQRASNSPPRLRSSWGGPSSMMRPSRSTTIRSKLDSVDSRWATATTVRLCTRSLSAAWISASDWVSS